MIRITRRNLLSSSAAGGTLLAMPHVARAQGAVVMKIGTAPAGWR